MRIIISGGPGAGCTSTAKHIASEFGISFFDSDSFFHKQTDPPYQEQYSAEERRSLVLAALSSHESWVLSGSISSWGVDLPQIDLGVYLDVPVAIRIQRLIERESVRFGDRILPDGDMHIKHSEFIQWASEYNERTGISRNRSCDREYLFEVSSAFDEISEDLSIESISKRVTTAARKLLKT